MKAAGGEEDAPLLPEGHSGHGEVFNQGPRQAAYLMDGIGRVRFDVTSDRPEAVAFVVQGIGQLHGFWFFESERSFRQAAKIDPECAISYWGMAMSNRENSDRAKGFIKEAMERRASASRREQLYIEALDRYLNAPNTEDSEKETRAVNYIEDLESLLFEFPDDIEAKAFLCEFQWSSRNTGVTLNSYLAVDALIQQIHDVEPLHQAHHYRIHLWDKKKAEKALTSAAICGPAAPSIAHMWHMPGHIYSKLNRYHDAVYHQEASARVDHAHMIKDMVLPDQIHNFAHNNEWCVRNLIHIGRVHDAITLAKNMIELPRHPEYNQIDESGSYKYGRERLLDVLRIFQLYDQLIELADSVWFQETGDETADVAVRRALACAYAMCGRPAEAKKIRQQLNSDLTEVKAEQDEAVTAAEGEVCCEEKSEPAVGEGTKDLQTEYESRVTTFQSALDEIDGRLAFHQGDYDAAVCLLENAEDVPPEDVIDVLLAAGRAEQALTKILSHVEKNPGQVRPLAALFRTHWAVGDKDEAQKTFESLRGISSAIDLDIPLFAELASAAGELGYSGDWRLPRELPADLGIRPNLDSLGPFRWQPVAAPEWTLKGVDGEPIASVDLGQTPKILIFYLGSGCLHCAEQLQKFHPHAEKFRDAGFDLLAISTDPQESLSTARDRYDGDFAFSLFADPEMDVFRKYRCFDDFEHQPLHGTFVIDAEGLIRWQDISFEPFMDPEFVLKEAQRLIGLTESPLRSHKGLAAAVD
ncbi:MAG: peroxiredoxin family protein [Fuerstiella sp.]|nr:peroxiredoxin family protein [Fuerstiella sp.]